jgi:predicted Zn-dependent protease
MLGRAQRTLAIALVRTDGAIELDPTWRAKTAEQKAQNVAWAVSSLERLRTQRKNDPAVDTDLGEALAKIDGRQEEARGILQSLSERDLMATPQGYAALGRLQNQAGNAAARDAAIQRCTAMAKDPEVCKVPASPSGQS